jgi:hypothetical protein
MWANHLYILILPLTCSSLGRQHGIGVDYNLLLFFNKSCLLEFELKTSISDTILNYYAPTNSAKSLS